MFRLMLGTLSGFFLWGLVVSYPFCNNWCLPDYYYGYGYGYVCCDTHKITEKLHCPLIKQCVNAEELKVCSTDNDCVQKELCCHNPCVKENHYRCMNATKKREQDCCVEIQSCANVNKNTTSCDSDDTCKRSEKCCHNPCVGYKTCRTAKPNCCQGYVGIRNCRYSIGCC